MFGNWENIRWQPVRGGKGKWNGKERRGGRRRLIENKARARKYHLAGESREACLPFLASGRFFFFRVASRINSERRKINLVIWVLQTIHPEAYCVSQQLQLCPCMGVFLTLLWRGNLECVPANLHDKPAYSEHMAHMCYGADFTKKKKKEKMGLDAKRKKIERDFGIKSKIQLRFEAAMNSTNPKIQPTFLDIQFLQRERESEGLFCSPPSWQSSRKVQRAHLFSPCADCTGDRTAPRCALMPLVVICNTQLSPEPCKRQPGNSEEQRGHELISQPSGAGKWCRHHPFDLEPDWSKRAPTWNRGSPRSQMQIRLPGLHWWNRNWCS